MKRLGYAVLFLLVVAVAAGAWFTRPIAPAHPALATASLPPVIPLREFYADQNSKYGYSLTVDGKRLAWLSTSWFRPLLNIQDLETGEIVSLRPPTGFQWYYWGPDGETMLFLQDRDGFENYVISAINMATPQATPRVFDFGKNTRSFIQHIPKQKSDEVLIGHNQQDPSRFRYYWLNFKTGETRETEELPRSGGAASLAFDIDGRIFGRTIHKTPKSGDWSFEALQLDGSWKEVASGDHEDRLSLFGRVTPGHYIYGVSNLNRDTTAAILFDLKTGNETVLHADDRVDIDWVYVNPATNRIQMISIQPGYQERVVFEDELRRTIERLGVPENAFVGVKSRAEDNSRSLFEVTTEKNGEQIFLHDAVSDTVRLLEDPPISQYAERIGRLEPVFIPARDGLSIPAFLSRPVGIEGPAPMVVLVHGGPQWRSYWGFNRFRNLLSNRGYAVLDVNYRGSWGYGRRFAEAAIGEIAGKMSSDIIDARKWAVDAGIADPDKTAIIGGSWGGFETLTAITQNPDLFAAAIEINGVSDLSTMLDEVPDYWRGWRDWLREYGADPATPEGREYLRSRSPISRADRIRTPLLIIQGANDPRVVQGQSDRIVEAMKANNVPHEYMLIDGAQSGHRINSWTWQKRYLAFRRMERFLAHHLGGRAGGFDYAIVGAYVLPE